MQTETISIDVQLEKYISKLQQASDIDFQVNYPNTWAAGRQAKFSFKRGPKWLKIIRSEAVFCFIDPSNGDIFKAAGYNTPAKGRRGNIFNEAVPLTEESLYR